MTHLREEESGSERLRNLPKVTQLGFKPWYVVGLTPKRGLLRHRSLEPSFRRCWDLGRTGHRVASMLITRPSLMDFPFSLETHFFRAGPIGSLSLSFPFVRVLGQGSPFSNKEEREKRRTF